MPNLLDLKRIYGLESKPNSIVRKNVLPSKESHNDPLPSRPRKKVIGDKTLDKDQMLEWFLTLFKDNGKAFTLDYLRGQKQNFESVFEMRKIKRL